MEADTDDRLVTNLSQTTLLSSATANTALSLPLPSVAMSPDTTTSTLPLSSSPCNTPLLDDVQHNLLKHQHVLHTHDSGFSDWTPDSQISLATSLSETPSLVQRTSCSPQSTTPFVSESDLADCFLRHHHRRSWPMRSRSRKLSFQSPESELDTTSESPSLCLRLTQEEECCHLPNNDNYSNSTANFHSSEEEVRLILSKSNLKKKHSPVGQFLERSARSFSRSPLSSSSSSDDLEGSFQEMSLEENSSSSNHQSPTLPSSSSPVFSFSLHHKSKHTVGTKAVITRKKGHHSSQEHPQSTHLHMDDSSSDSDREERQVSIFTQSSSNQHPTIMSTDKNVIPSQSCETEVFSMRNNSDLCVVDNEHNVKTAASSHIHSHSPLVIESLKPHTSHNSLLSSPSLHHPNIHHIPCTTCYHHNPSSISTSADNFIKSPTKRTSDNLIPHLSCKDIVSPQKMRKLRFRGKPSTQAICSVQRDLFSSQDKGQDDADTDIDSPFSSDNEYSLALSHPRRPVMRCSDERTPQFFPLPHTSRSRCPRAVTENSPVKSLVTPVSRWRPPNQRFSKNIKTKKQESKQSEDNLVDRVCLKFSPSVPSQLIGRQVGVGKFDILGELYRRNFTGCVEKILSYLLDSELLKMCDVNPDWKSAVHTEPRSFRRLKTWRKKIDSPRKVKNQAEKENVGKHVDRVNVSMTASKGHLMAIQPQFVLDTPDCPPTAPLLTPQAHTQNSDVLLSLDDRTRNCPHCQCRAMVVPSQDRAICTSDKCSYDFCTKCFFPFHHPAPCKPLCQSQSKTMLAGSKKSKKNLKRLKNL